MVTKNGGDTLLEDLQRHLQEHHKIAKETLLQLDCFLKQELYDSDALEMDVAGNSTDSNIGSIGSINSKCYKVIQQYMSAAIGMCAYLLR